MKVVAVVFPLPKLLTHFYRVRRIAVRHAPVLLVVAFLLPMGAFPAVVRGGQIDIDPDSVAAIAYSPSTGEFGYAYNYEDRESAEKAALKNCSPKDARIVCWVKSGSAPGAGR